MFRNASIYDLCTWIHHYSTKPILHNCSYAGMRDFAHQGPAFTTWHRLLLLFLERQIHLLTGDDCFALPFYDWSKDKNCSICSDELLGSNDKKGNILESSSFSSWGAICSHSDSPNNYCQSAARDGYGDTLHRNPGFAKGSSLPTLEDVLNTLNWTVYDAPPYDRTAKNCFRNVLEGFLNPSDGMTFGFEVHNKLHNYMGGTMFEITSSANDPMFIVHHNFIDSIVETWIRRHGVTPGDFPECGLPGQDPLDFMVPFFPRYQNRDLLQTSLAFGYTFSYLPGAV
ncbi:tyrosinase-like [Engystomops pustulosus]|uniref:tyrosinase-like n=1 Tax=Engystomops pustulosus TaxID=76066 RepID=UPI003AFB6F1B